MEDLALIMTTVESACKILQVGRNFEAESVITGFQKSPSVIPASIYILERSQSNEACFQAASSLCKSMIQQWTVLSKEMKNFVLDFSLKFITNRAMAAPYVLRKVISTASSILKQSWQDMTKEEKDSFFTTIYRIAIGQGEYPPGSRRWAVACLEEIAIEFSTFLPASNLTVEQHNSCKQSFEALYLPTFYQAAVDLTVAHSLTEAMDGDEERSGILLASLQLLLCVFNWIPTNSKICPAVSDFVSTPSRMSMLLPIYLKLRPSLHSQQKIEGETASVFRQIVLQLACFAGLLERNRESQIVFVRQILLIVVQWLLPISTAMDSVSSGEPFSEILDGCRIMAALAKCSTVDVFDAALQGQIVSGATIGSTTELLTSLTCSCIHHGGCTEEESSMQSVFDALLEVWMPILQASEIPGSVRQLAARVVQEYLQVKLASTAGVGPEEEEEGDDTTKEAREDEISTIALMVRVSPLFSLPLLSRLMEDRKISLLQVVHSGKVEDITSVLDELIHLLSVAGHSLADAGVGEVPLVPAALSSFAEPPLNNSQECISVINFSRSCFQLAWMTVDASIHPEKLSPCYMETVVWFLARWCKTYLSSEFWCVTVLGNGKPGDVAVGLRATLEVAFKALVAWPGENHLQGLVCSSLLPAMVERSSLNISVIHMEPWRELEKAFGGGHPSMFALPGPHQRTLSQVLCSAASLDTAHCTERLHSILHSSISSATKLCSDRELPQLVHRPDVIHHVEVMLEHLRGFALGCKASSLEVVTRVGLQLQEPLIVLFDAFSSQPPMVHLILKFWVEWLDSVIAYIDLQQCHAVFHYCSRLLQLYATKNCGKISVQSSQNLAKESESDRYKDLRTLLQLLVSITSKDLVDLSKASTMSDSLSTEIAKVVSLGLHIILPLLNQGLLQYPKLCSQYYELLEHLLSVHAIIVLDLPPNMFDPLLQTVQWGLQHQDSQIVCLCLSSIDSIATCYWEGSKSAGPRNPATSPPLNVLLQFQNQLFARLLDPNLSASSKEPYIDALFPLLLIEPGPFKAMLEDAIKNDVNAQRKDQVVSIVSKLESTVAQGTTHRAIRKEFRSSCRQLFNLIHKDV